ncbi:hypothetical protein SDJN02_14884, partial [Cucurbita argyrosperma subsp. argyrosperma]
WERSNFSVSIEEAEFILFVDCSGVNVSTASTSFYSLLMITAALGSENLIVF